MQDSQNYVGEMSSTAVVDNKYEEIIMSFRSLYHGSSASHTKNSSLHYS